jgi:PIN domain nuclease of toxin-antitoxin system
VVDVRLLLDTVAFIYALEAPEKLGKRAATALDREDSIVELSTISLAEIAIKASSGKLDLSLETISQSLIDLDLHVLPYSAEHALRLFGLPLHHRDPFDRQIIAQALTERIAVVTSDRAFSLYDQLKVIW